MLEDINPNSLVYHLSITNEAQKLLCVSNQSHFLLSEYRILLLSQEIQNDEDQLFWEGTGCWNPTFRASFFDINGLLNCAIREINNMFWQKKKFETFLAYYDANNIGISKDTTYYQPELDLHLSISGHCMQKIKNYAVKHFPKEFGGLLLGNYTSNNKGAMVVDIVVPPKNRFRNTKISFSADYYALNAELWKIELNPNKNIKYIGEWHTHPNGGKQYSNIDYRSIKDVAKAETVPITNPLLLIASLGEEYFDLNFYVYKDDVLFEFDRITDNY